MYYESQGVTDIAIKLYFLAQRYAIVTGEECITRETIQQTAKMGLHSLQLFLEYMRDNNTRKIKTYRDLPLQDVEFTYQQAEQALLKRVEVVPAATLGSAGVGEDTSSNETAQDVGAGKNEIQRKLISPSLTNIQRTSETLPQIVAQGLKKQQLAAYEALKQGGFTCNAVEFLLGESLP